MSLPRALVCVSSLIALYAFVPVAHGEEQPPAQLLDVRQLMTAAEFKEAGLSKLTEAELGKLNAWLNRLAARVLEVASSSAEVPSGNVIESQIDGDFEGWDGDTIFKLLNGQIWQQASYAYHYHYAFMPDVLIYKTSSGYKMKVEGVGETITVRRLK